MNFNYKKILFRYLFLVVIISLLNSCYTHKDKTLLQTSTSLPQYKKVEYQHYKIEINDEILFRIVSTDEEFIKLINAGNDIQQQKLSYRVYPDGTIDLPFLRPIRVVGLTLPEATRKIQLAFRKRMPDAEVKITLANKSYTVIGDVGTGIFPIYKERLTIYQALAQSGEIMLSGDRKHVKIVRNVNKTPEILEFDIRPQSVIDSKYYYIYPNDIIYVRREPASFYKATNYSAFVGIITSSFSLFTTVYYYTKLNQSSK